MFFNQKTQQKTPHIYGKTIQNEEFLLRSFTGELTLPHFSKTLLTTEISYANVEKQ